MLGHNYLIRALHTSKTLLMRRIRRTNAGVFYQLNELQHEDELSADPEGFANVESTFMDAHKSHRQHEEEMQQYRDLVRLKMVQRKYFRDPPLPNLLTYAEKEQMRLLHTRDGDEWTAERLSESFPATPDTVRKVLAANWRPYTVKRIHKHDEAVIQNWEKLRGPDSAAEWAKLPTELSDHLKKFAERRPEDLRAVSHQPEWTLRPALPKPKGNEFLSLIKSKHTAAVSPNAGLLSAPGQQHPPPQTQLQLLNTDKSERKENAQNKRPPTTPADDETFLLAKVKDKRSMRLQELKQLKLTPADLSATLAGAPLALQDPAQLAEAITTSNPSGTGILPKKSPHPAATLPDYTNKFSSTEIVISPADQKRFEMTRAKDRVHIPRKLWRKDATYRVEDCYYDDDGEFLYRVPGMTGS